MSSTPEPIVRPQEDWHDLYVEPDISGIEIEDGAPVDIIYSEKQQRLLTTSLYASWVPRSPDDEAPRPFFAASNVGVFATTHGAALVPDVLLSVDVSVHPDAPRDKRHNTYFPWEMGKIPDVVIEIVTNRKGKELTTRKRGYERMRVPYYVVWDPEHIANDNELQAFVGREGGYVPMLRATLTSLGDLSLRPWEGRFEGLQMRWLRWYEGDSLLLTGEERAEAEAQRAEAEAQRAEAEAQRAEAEAQRAEAEAQRADRLAALLAAHGISFDA